MITDLDESIKQLLIKKGELNSGEIEISFETPDREWSASISKPRINLYLYDIRENHELRGTEWRVNAEKNGMATRKKNPARIDLSYLVTIWAHDIADEHRLLWHVLMTLFKHPILPDEVLPAALVEQEYPVTTLTAQPDGLLQNPADFWTALDNNLKPAINYVVTVPLDLSLKYTLPVTKSSSLGVKPLDGETETMMQITGLVHRSGSPGKVISDATVFAREAMKTAKTDNEGRYALNNISQGKYTFQVLVSGKVIRELQVNIPSASYDLAV
jgi:hypothetical protein